MNVWLHHDPSSLISNIPAALMPRFGRADNIRRYDFRAHLKDVFAQFKFVRAPAGVFSANRGLFVNSGNAGARQLTAGQARSSIDVTRSSRRPRARRGHT
jgi:hypothetical protein